jgi:hypothetical protein
MPSKWWYRAAFATVVLGGIAAFAWFNWALDDQSRHVQDFTRLPPRSGIPVEIAEPGTYTVWAGAACGGLCDIPPLDEMRELIVLSLESPSGEVVEPTPFPGSDSYRLDGANHGKALWLIEIPEAGTYQVERRNLGVGAVNLLLGQGQGLSADIGAGLVVIAIVTVVVTAALVAIGWYRERRAVMAMVEHIHGR